MTFIKYIPRYSYTMYRNCRTGSKLSDDLQSTDGSCRCFPTLSEEEGFCGKQRKCMRLNITDNEVFSKTSGT